MIVAPYSMVDFMAGNPWFHLAVIGLLLALLIRRGRRAIAAEQALQFQVGFSPKGDSLNLLQQQIQAAQSEILVLCYAFNSQPIANALLKALARGVAVRVVSDYRQAISELGAVSPQMDIFNQLSGKGAIIKLNRTLKSSAQHDKVMVFDRQHVATGSFNFTYAAQSSNSENLLIVQNAQQLAEVYTKHFFYCDSQAS